MPCIQLTVLRPTDINMVTKFTSGCGIGRLRRHTSTLSMRLRGPFSPLLYTMASMTMMMTATMTMAKNAKARGSHNLMDERRPRQRRHTSAAARFVWMCGVVMIALGSVVTPTSISTTTMMTAPKMTVVAAFVVPYSVPTISSVARVISAGTTRTRSPTAIMLGGGTTTTRTPTKQNERDEEGDTAPPPLGMIRHGGRREMMQQTFGAAAAATTMMMMTTTMIMTSGAPVAQASGGATAGRYTTIPIAKRRYYGRVQQGVHEFLQLQTAVDPKAAVGSSSSSLVQHFFDTKGTVIVAAKSQAIGGQCTKQDTTCKGKEIRDSRYNDMKTSMYLLGNAFRTDQQKPPDRLPTVKAARAFFKEMDQLEKVIVKNKSADPVVVSTMYQTALTLLDTYLDLVELPPTASGHYDQEFDTLVGQTARLT